MSTRYFKDPNGLKMVIEDPLGNTQYCPTSGFIECDANWQPLKPAVREWVRGDEHWRWDGEKMTYTEGTYNPRVTREVPKELEKARSCFEVHPGTRTPIDQPLPPSEPAAKAEPVVREWVSDMLWDKNRWRQEGDGPLMYLNDAGVWLKSDWNSVAEGMAIRAYEVHPGTRTPINQPLPSSEPPAKAVREFSHHTDFRFTGDRCEASVNNGPWRPVNDTIEDMAAIGAEEVNREPAKPEPTHQPKDQQDMSICEYLLDSNGRPVKFPPPPASSEPSVAYLGGKLNAVAEAVSGLSSRVENIEAELHATSDRMREHEKNVAEQWRVRSVECDAMANTMGRMARRIEALETKTSEPIHIQVASLIAVNQKLEAELRIVRNERDDLLSRVQLLTRKGD